VELRRSAGVQLHPTSLPAGRLGRDAYAWVDWLAAAGQTWWQMLPLGPPDRYHSPYKSASAFAAWPGLLAEPAAPVAQAEELDFREREASWIEDWARFAGRGATADQIRFEREWTALRTYAGERGVRLIGDVPIYVAPSSADIRAHPELFRGDAVAGTPPDAYTDEGQLWGNPLYDWPALQRRGYAWWIARLARTFSLFDLARIDHFRGFVAYWAVPKGARSALRGRWRRGPGRAVFDAASAALGDLPLIAEDLGVITPAVQRLRDGLRLPGMVVLQFGFAPGEPGNVHDVANHGEHRIAYTGTHDNDTLRGWYETLPEERRALVDAARPRREREVWWDLIALTFSSRARVAMVQAQDVLGLGGEARMNQPGRASGAWRWRLDTLPSGELARRLAAATEAAGRAA
jgi:4-alpha-glucanotransferase